MSNSNFYDNKNSFGSQFPGRIKNGILEKKVKVENFLRYIQGYALAEEQLLLAKALGVSEVRLVEKSTKKIFSIGLDFLLTHGRKIHHPPYEPQIGLALKQWNRLNGNAKQPELWGA